MKEPVEEELRPWAVLTIRGFGFAHIIFALVGIYLTGEAQIRFAQTPSLGRAGPYRFEVFYAMVVIDLLCNLTLLYTAGFLFRLERRGLLIANVLFIVELVYLIGRNLASVGLGLLGGEAVLLGQSIAEASTIASLATAPQHWLGYPVTPLIVLNLAYLRLFRPQPTTDSQTKVLFPRTSPAGVLRRL